MLQLYSKYINGNLIESIRFGKGINEWAAILQMASGEKIVAYSSGDIKKVRKFIEELAKQIGIDGCIDEVAKKVEKDS